MRHAARGTPIAAPDTRQLPDLIGTSPPRRLPVDHGVKLLSPFPQRQPGDHLHLQDDVTSPQFQLLPAGRASNTKEKEETKTETARNLSPEKKNPPKSRRQCLTPGLTCLDRSTTPAPPKQANSHPFQPPGRRCLRLPTMCIRSQSVDETGRCKGNTRNNTRYPSVRQREEIRDGRTGQVHRTRPARPPGANARVCER